MIILSLELSSPVASLALLEEGQERAVRSWRQTRDNGQLAFSVWRELLAEHGLRPEDIGLYVCGRGPGSFSGARMAVTAVRLAARPRRTPAYIVSSGEAVAARAADRTPADDIVVIGDARRGLRWWGRFRRAGTLLQAQGDWALSPAGEWLRNLPSRAVLASPDWSGLNRVLTPEEREDPRWITEDCPPTAAAAARMALARRAAGIPSDPPEPLYLHAAVRSPASP